MVCQEILMKLTITIVRSSILGISFHLPCSTKPKYCLETYTSNKYSGKDRNDIPAGEPQLEQQIAKELSLLEEISHVKICMVP